MTPFEIVLVILVIVVICFLLYYFLKGRTGKISLSNPIESRIDQYLDIRFEDMVREWSLVTKPGLAKFEMQNIARLKEGEEIAENYTQFEDKIGKTLKDLEERLESLEKEIGKH